MILRIMGQNIIWMTLYENPSAITLIRNYIKKNGCKYLCSNPAAINIIGDIKNNSYIYFGRLCAIPAIFTIDIKRHKKCVNNIIDIY